MATDALLANQPAASALGGSELTYMEQSGTSVYALPSQFKTYIIGAGSVSVASGKTLTVSNTLTFTATDGSTLAIGAGGTLGGGAYAAAFDPTAPGAIGGAAPAAGTFTTVADAKGEVRLIPQNSQSAAYTTVLADAGKHLLHPSADTTARTFTIDANGTVAYPVGTAITFVNQASAGVLTIAITTDTMRLAGAGTTGSRTLAANGTATALKLTSTEWIISGTGLT